MGKDFNTVYDREKKTCYKEKIYGYKQLNFYYNTFWGRVGVKIITWRFLSKLYGWYMSSKFSVKKIEKFIEANNIDMSEYENKEYASFNEFFARKILPENRKIDSNENALISIADSKLKYVKITEDVRLKIKNTTYSVEELVKDKELASKYINGDCLIFRLTVSDYHRYCYLDNGRQGKNRKIKGVLHTVNSISQDKYKIYAQNAREYTVLDTEHFGQVVQVEVGALQVGKIKNHNENNEFCKGEEKGYFEYGGSTIILLFENGRVKMDEDIVENSMRDIETKVKLGERIGEITKNIVCVGG